MLPLKGFFFCCLGAAHRSPGSREIHTGSGVHYGRKPLLQINQLWRIIRRPHEASELFSGQKGIRGETLQAFHGRMWVRGRREWFLLWLHRLAISFSN